MLVTGCDPAIFAALAEPQRYQPMFRLDFRSDAAEMFERLEATPALAETGALRHRTMAR
jgi:hypothetical protein